MATADTIRSYTGKNPDKLYRKWMHTQRVEVPVEPVRRWLDGLIERLGGVRPVGAKGDDAYADGLAQAVALTGGCPRHFLRIRSGESTWVEYAKAEAIAMASGHLAELACLVKAPGVDGWSEVGRSCGDGAGPYDGCGTFHHESYLYGLCEECFDRELLGADIEPRDVRVSRELRGMA